MIGTFQSGNVIPAWKVRVQGLNLVPDVCGRPFRNWLQVIENDDEEFGFISQYLRLLSEKMSHRKQTDNYEAAMTLNASWIYVVRTW